MPQSDWNRRVLAELKSRANEQREPEPAWLSAAAGTKRKATETPLDPADVDDISLDGMPMDASCNQVRGKIRRFLEAGEMKKGEFADALGVSSKSLNDFLGRGKGPMDGSGSATYGAAWEFFKKREMAGIKAPAAKKAKATTASAPVAVAVAEPVTDIRGISLSGEASDSVPVYDSCDEVRKKIAAHLLRSGVTQAQFCRDLSAQLHTEVKKIQSKQLSDFRSKTGATSGNTSIVYYTAYCYFEKMRLAEGKPKSKHRVGMEGTWPGGVDTTRVRNHAWCPQGRRPVMDTYGKVTIR
ncbi:hypothetical protein M409DRAFT_19577 [Zasmidium cellare ATCC 36951]|uniref:DUF7726 domain-containing protein n=1 Tax=Zasmidium cellare ATCC 36951 TaxID=1080233 RepID=A0A6A6CVW8_ZASCE|nr:uncharacterized protein M409DRAFT_19577 [Zasmidium cellare ATCC 36951]KAF2169962.1 hypothetical protein M409DRAFT_19577 [Zasmidium cellare ATCC 36951]